MSVPNQLLNAKRPMTNISAPAPIDRCSSNVVTIHCNGMHGGSARKVVSRRLAAAIVSAMLFSNLLPGVTTAMAATEPDAAAGDMCGHVQNHTVRALISSPDAGAFSAEAIRNEPGKLTCIWSALKTGAPDGSAPDATLTLDLYHFASIARARTELRGFGVAPHAPQLVKTDSADDEIIQLSPGMKAARHDAEVAVARATAPQSVSSLPDWEARFEALTLAGSGAQVQPPPKPADAAPNTPPPAVAPLPRAVRADGGTGAAPQWTPPAHAAPAGSGFYDPVLGVVASAASMPNPFYLLFPCMIIGPLLLAFVLPVIFLSRKPSLGGRIALGVLGYGLGLGLAVVNLSYGAAIASRLIYHFGVAGSAIVTGSYQTANVYNNQDVIGYNILIRTADGKVVDSSFETDDFNVYPPRNATNYPNVGDAFTVRYLAHAPQTFVIVADDDSPWVRGLRCYDLNQVVSEAAQKTNFAPDNTGYRAVLAQAVDAAQQAGCGVVR
jgi:hypothetical protein